MSNVFYHDFGRSVSCKVSPYTAEPDRVDMISYVPVERSIQNFIASGASVTSLRSADISVDTSTKRQKTISELEKSDMSVFDRNIYGVDLAEASMAVKKFDSKTKEAERKAKEAPEAIKFCMERSTGT